MAEHERPGRTSRGKGFWIGVALLVVAAAGIAYLSVERFAGTSEASAAARAEAPPTARAIYERCADRSGQEASDCYREALTERLREAGVAETMETLIGLTRLDEDLQRDAHVYAHHVGIMAYDMNPEVSDVFPECSDMFSSGCYHGVIQAYFENRAGGVDAEAVNELCRSYEDSDSPDARWILFQCLHGMGHGLTMYYDFDLPKALETCDMLDENWDRESCYGGAFMENIMAATSPHHPATVLAGAGGEGEAEGTGGRGAGDHAVAGPGDHAHGDGSDWKPLDPEDPLYPCSVMEDRYLQQCYLMQTSAMLQMNGGDLGEAAESCLDAPEGMRPTCFQSLGRDISSHTRQDPERSAEECFEVDERYRTSCFIGAVKAFVDWTSRPDEGLELCRRVPDGEGSNKRACYHALGEEIASLTGDLARRGEMCGRAEASWVGVCRRGAHLPATESGSSGTR